MQAIEMDPLHTTISDEKKHYLEIMQSMFGDQDEWRGKESISNDDDDENVSVDVAVSANTAPSMPVPLEETEETEEQITLPQTTPAVQTTRLKDLFKPREEEDGKPLHVDNCGLPSTELTFVAELNLFGDDDLDLDPELADIFGASDVRAPVPTPTSQPIPAASQKIASIPVRNNHNQTITVDYKAPFFFPLPEERSGNNPRDILNLLTTRVGDQFVRSGTS